MNTMTGPCPSCARNMEIPPGYIEEIVAVRMNSGVNLAGDDLYNARLERCRSCESCAGDIMCRICGCFIQFRALGADSYCPHPNGDQWVSGKIPVA